MAFSCRYADLVHSDLKIILFLYENFLIILFAYRIILANSGYRWVFFFEAVYTYSSSNLIGLLEIGLSPSPLVCCGSFAKISNI